MADRLKKIIQNSIGLIIGGVFLFLTLNNKPLSDIWESLQQAHIFYIALSFVCLSLVFYLRAIRWKLLIEETGETVSQNKVFNSLLIGYFVNSFTPKFGEILRCTSLQKSAKIPASTSAGSVVAERAYDLLILLIGIVIIFWIEIDKIGHLLTSTLGQVSSIFSNTGLYIIFSVGLIFAVLFFTFLKRLKQSKNKIVVKLIDFIENLLLALRKGILLQKRTKFFLLTAAIWLSLILLNYIYLLSLPETQSFSIAFAAIVLFIGGLGWALPSPGGIGTTHFILLQLFIAYQLDEKAGISFGILSNGLTFIGTIIIGGYGYLRYWLQTKNEKMQEHL